MSNVALAVIVNMLRQWFVDSSYSNLFQVKIVRLLFSVFLSECNKYNNTFCKLSYEWDGCSMAQVIFSHLIKISLCSGKSLC